MIDLPEHAPHRSTRRAPSKPAGPTDPAADATVLADPRRIAYDVLVDDYDRLSGSTARNGGFTGVRVQKA